MKKNKMSFFVKPRKITNFLPDYLIFDKEKLIKREIQQKNKKEEKK